MIKVIVFDFDDTLYTGDVWQNWTQYSARALREAFHHLNDEQFQNLIKKHKINFEGHLSGKTVRDVMRSELGNVNKWKEFIEQNDFQTDFNKAKPINNAVLEELHKQYPLYIVTNSANRWVTKFGNHLGIRLNLFKKIFSNPFLQEDDSKTPCFKQILEIEGVEPDEVLMVGDSYEADIVPALALGMRAKWVKNCNFTAHDLLNY